MGFWLGEYGRSYQLQKKVEKIHVHRQLQVRSLRLNTYFAAETWQTCWHFLRALFTKLFFFFETTKVEIK